MRSLRILDKQKFRLFFCNSSGHGRCLLASLFERLCIGSILTYLLTYLLTPWNRVFDKLTGFQLVKTFHTFYENRRFITTFKITRQLSLCWASSILSITPNPTYWRSILILSSHLSLVLTRGLFPTCFPTKPCIRLSYPPHILHAQPIRFYHPNNIGWAVQVIKLLIM